MFTKSALIYISCESVVVFYFVVIEGDAFSDCPNQLPEFIANYWRVRELPASFVRCSRNTVCNVFHTLFVRALTHMYSHTLVHLNSENHMVEPPVCTCQVADLNFYLRANIRIALKTD